MMQSTDMSLANSFKFRKNLYLLLAIAGSIALTSDLLISVVVFFCLAWIELKRLGVSRLWMLVYVGLTSGVGLSCALPFFLYRRELKMEEMK